MKSKILLCSLASCCIAFGAVPSALEILQRTASAYRDLQSYEFRVAVQTVRGASVAERHLTVTGSGRVRYRVESADPAADLQVADGAALWSFTPQSKEYSKRPLEESSQGPLTAFQEIDQHVTGAGIAREEQFLVNGKPVPIYVVRVSRDRWPQGSLEGAEYAMYRIDKKSFVVYKAITYSPTATQIVLYSIVKWNQPVDAARFAFTPPASARLATSISGASVKSTAIVGTEAPDFTLQDAAGRSVNLRALRGKVVVVDFWATWCGPCRAAMPKLQEMHHDLAEKGLVVLGLDVGEDAGTVTGFAKENSYTFPLLLGAEPDVSARYFVEAYPTTFVIDRQGRIAFRELGGASPEKLRAAVEAALGGGR